MLVLFFTARVAECGVVFAGGMVIDGSSYNRVIRAWGDTKQPQRAEQCLAHMRESGVTPDQFCYNSVINAWADAKQPDKVYTYM